MKRFHTIASPALEKIPEALPDVSRYFCLFLAIDAVDLSNASILSTARKLVERGAVYVCVWGSDCERVHDCFDEQSPIEESPGQNDVVMTTWHGDESLEEALWFFMNCTIPTESFVAQCKDWVAVSISNEEWQQKILAVMPPQRYEVPKTTE
jgi:hypothetical protein